MKKINQHKNSILIFGILILAAFLRLYKIQDYLTFLGDEGRDVLIAYNILHGHLTLLGPTASVGGFFLGPAYYYFIAPFLFLFHYNPVGPAVMVALLGVTTVYLIYRIGKEFFNAWTGLIAAFLYAISPFIIAYSRSSWNPNVMPFFSLLTGYVLYKAVMKKSMYLFGIVGVLFGILMQLHYLATFLGVIFFLYVLIIDYVSEKRNIRKTLLKSCKEYAGMFIGFLIGFSPFLAFELRHGFTNIKSILNFIFHSGNTGGNTHFVTTVGTVVFRMFGRLMTDYPPPEQIQANLHQNIGIWTIGTLALELLALGIFLYRYIQIFRKKEIDGENLQTAFAQMTLLFLWFFAGVLLFGLYKKQIYDYYFAFMFPLPFLFVGNAFSFLWEKRLPFKIVVIAALSVLIYLSYQGNVFHAVPNRQLQQAETIARFVYDKTDNKPYNFALVSGNNSDYAYRYFFTVWGRPPVIIENAVIDPSRKTTTNQLFVVCEIPCEPLGHSLFEIAGFGRADIAGKWHVIVVDVYKLIPYKGKK